MENKPICEIDTLGNKRWYLNGLYHREDGPAIELKSGTKKWLVNNKFHRLDGPAIEWNDGSCEWWINGFFVDEEITTWASDNDIDLDNLTDVDKALIKIVWADYGQ